MIKRVAVAFALASLMLAPVPSLEAQAEHPIQLALLPDIQLVSQDDAVRGLRLSFYGRNVSMTGLDIGVVNETTRDFLGVQFGAVNLGRGTTTGFQSGIANIVEGSFEGFQYGVLNWAETGYGFQWGAFNHSRNFRGLQLAFVNYAQSMHGVQIGFVNIIREGGVLPVMPLVNWSLDEGREPN